MTNHKIGTTESDFAYNNATYFVRSSTILRGHMSADGQTFFLTFGSANNDLSLHLNASSLTPIIDALVAIRREIGLNDDDPKEGECPPSVPA